VKVHAVPENDNNAVDFVSELLVDLAIEHNMAVDCPHHTRKGPADPGDADMGRGAGAFKNGGRLVYTLTEMSIEQARQFNISPGIRKSFVRMDSAKVNIAPPAASAKWFRLVGVKIDNPTELYPNGDEVQVIERWTPPDLWQHVNPVVNHILELIEPGPADGQRYSMAPQSGKTRGAWAVVMKVVGPDKISKEQCQQVIKTWGKKGVLEERSYDDPIERKPLKGAYVISRPGAC
jgi:hypothetical protein